MCFEGVRFQEKTKNVTKEIKNGPIDSKVNFLYIFLRRNFRPVSENCELDLCTAILNNKIHVMTDFGNATFGSSSYLPQNNKHYLFSNTPF